jgi:hypothetical protein
MFDEVELRPLLITNRVLYLSQKTGKSNIPKYLPLLTGLVQRREANLWAMPERVKKMRLPCNPPFPASRRPGRRYQGRQ